jgi:hypothetical protein
MAISRLIQIKHLDDVDYDLDKAHFLGIGIIQIEAWVILKRALI